MRFPGKRKEGKGKEEDQGASAPSGTTGSANEIVELRSRWSPDTSDGEQESVSDTTLIAIQPLCAWVLCHHVPGL